jgi:glycosyltransferase involved in cell wall biosynthesis
VIPVRDMAAYVREAIESVLAQDGGEWDLVVVDDGSADGSGDVARRYAGERVQVIRQEGLGEGPARNRGFQASSADAVLFLDADDRLRPGALGRLTEMLDRHPEAAAVYGEVASIDRDGRVFGGGRRPLTRPRPSGDVLTAFLRGGCVATPGAVCMRRRHLERAGLFRSLPLSADWELYCRLALEGAFLYLGGAPVVEYRSHPGSVTSSRGERVENAWPSIDAVFSNPGILSRFPEPALRGLRRQRVAGAYAFAGRIALKNGRFKAARESLLRCLRLSPLRPLEATLLVAAVAGWVPGPLRRRIK